MSKILVNELAHTNDTTAMTVDSSGRVAMPNKVAFTVGYNSTTGAYAALVTSLGLTGVVPFNFVIQGGTNGTHPNWSNTTHAFTAPIAGAYYISVAGLWETTSSGDIRIAKNQNYVNQARFYEVGNRGVTGSVVLDLAVNDVIQLQSPYPLYMDFDNVYSFMSIAFLG